MCSSAFLDGFTTTQAPNCAAMVCTHEGVTYVCGYYGSAYDTTLYRVKDVPASWHDADPVCDACVRLQLDGGNLEEQPGSYPWGPPWLELSDDWSDD